MYVYFLFVVLARHDLKDVAAVIGDGEHAPGGRIDGRGLRDPHRAGRHRDRLDVELELSAAERRDDRRRERSADRNLVRAADGDPEPPAGDDANRRRRPA
jgi:hypothetical protein